MTSQLAHAHIWHLNSSAFLLYVNPAIHCTCDLIRPITELVKWAVHNVYLMVVVRYCRNNALKQWNRAQIKALREYPGPFLVP